MKRTLLLPSVNFVDFVDSDVIPVVDLVISSGSTPSVDLAVVSVVDPIVGMVSGFVAGTEEETSINLIFFK